MAPGKPGYHEKTRREHIHVTLPIYLLDYIEELARAHNTSRAHEIAVCILLRYLNHGHR